MSGRRLGLMVVCVAVLMDGRAASATVRRLSLGAAEQTRLTRFLFPLPQDCRLVDAAFAVEPAACSLDADPKLTDQEAGFVADFRARWQTRFGAELSTQPPRAAGLRIVVGRVGRHPVLDEAARGGLLDLKHLALRPNADQAYAITCAETPEGVTACLAANDSSGLFYALATFEQLLDGLGSQGAAVRVPQVRIVDWPDIRRRGTIGGIDAPMFKPDAADTIWRPYAQGKLNVYYGWVWPQVSKEKPLHFGSCRRPLERAGRNNVLVAACIAHVDQLLGVESELAKAFPEILGDQGTNKKNHGPWCYANPRSREVMIMLIEAFARDVDSDYLWMWPSKHDDPCCCPVCKGDRRKQMENEFKAIMDGFGAARAIRPSLRMDIITTQGTYRHNMALLPIIPKTVGIDYYNGSSDKMGHTYITAFEKYIIPPSVHQVRLEGYRVGAVPLLNSNTDGDLLYPFHTPLFVKLRMSEIADCTPDGVAGWMSSRLSPFNRDAMAEFAWNSRGRNAEEFAIARATRRGFKDPAQVARAIGLLETPARVLSVAGIGDPFRSLERAVSLLLGEKPEWGSYFDVERNLEFGSNEELRRMIEVCDRGAALCEGLDGPELLAGARLVRQWLAILERDTFFRQDEKDAGRREDVRQAILQLARGLPELQGQWLATVPDMDPEHRTKAERVLKKAMKQFERLAPR